MHEILRYLVRIQSKNRNTIGAGFLAAPDIVLTCEHVVRKALDFSEWSPQEKEAAIPLYLCSNERLVFATVEKIDPEKDIAVLRLGEPQSTVSLNPLIALEYPFGHQFITCGFPKGQKRWGKGTLYERDHYGRIQLTSEDAQHFGFYLGFSGAPVWVDSSNGGGIVGMIVEVEKSEGSCAWCIPSQELFEFANSDYERLSERPKVVQRLDSMDELLAQKGLNQFKDSPFVAMALAIESLRLRPNPDGNELICRCSCVLPRIIARLESEEAGNKLIWVKSVAISPNKKFVAAGYIHGGVVVWDVEACKRIWSWLHDRAITQVLFSPDNRFLAFGDEGGTLTIREIAQGQVIFSSQEKHRVISIDFSPDSQLIACGIFNGTVTIWNIYTKNEVYRRQHKLPISLVSFCQNGRWLVIGDDETVKVWDWKSGNLVRELVNNSQTVAFSPGKDQLVVKTNEGLFLYYETSTWQEIRQQQIVEGSTPIALYPKGGFVAVSVDKEVRVIDAENQEKARMIHNSGVCSVTLSTDGEWIASGDERGNVMLWESVANPLVEQIATKTLSSLAICSNGIWIAGSTGSVIQVWEKTEQWQERVSLRLEGELNISSLTFSPNGKWMAGGGRQKVKIWKTGTWEDTSEIPIPDRVRSMVFDPTESFVFIACENGSLVAWEIEAQQILGQEKYDPQLYYSLSFTNKHLIVGYGGGMIRIFSWASSTPQNWNQLTPQKEIRAFSTPITTLAISQSLIAVGSWTGVRVWDIDAEPHQMLCECKIEGKTKNEVEDPVFSVAFSPDGCWIAGGGNGIVRVWKATTGREIARMEHNDDVLAVAFSPDGRSIISGSKDGTILVWPWRPEDLVAEACRRLPRNLTREEWGRYIGPEVPYRPTCPNLPVPGD